MKKLQWALVALVIAMVNGFVEQSKAQEDNSVCELCKIGGAACKNGCKTIPVWGYKITCSFFFNNLCTKPCSEICGIFVEEEPFWTPAGEDPCEIAIADDFCWTQCYERDPDCCYEGTCGPSYWCKTFTPLNYGECEECNGCNSVVCRSYTECKAYCFNGAHNLGEDGVDCGGPCPNKCEEESTPVTVPDTCPGGYSAGDYCGDVGLDQTPEWLYHCSAGKYSLKDTCEGGHCEVQPLGKNDFCVVEVSINPVEPPDIATTPELEADPDPDPITTSIPPVTTMPPEQEPATTPDPATQPEPVCEPGDTIRQTTVCINPNSEAGEILDHAVKEMKCTVEGQWPLNWEPCYQDTPCSTPDEIQVVRCTATTVQERVCAYDGWWRNWSECLPGELPEPDPGQNPDPDPGCVCTNNACCDGCNYLPASATCEGWNLYRCVGQEVQGRQAERHCSGSSELCQGGGGQVEYTDWQYVETCAASEICQVLGSDGSYECANLGTCSITYTVNNNTSCYGNPSGSGAPTICLEVQQSNGSDWQWQVCKEGSKFGPDFSVTLVDQNHTSESLASPYVFSNSNPDAALGCTPWLPLSVSYLEEYGLPEGAAGIVAQVKSPSTCSQNACLYNTGTDITVRRECL